MSLNQTFLRKKRSAYALLWNLSEDKTPSVGNLVFQLFSEYVYTFLILPKYVQCFLVIDVTWDSELAKAAIAWHSQGNAAAQA